VSLHTDTGAYCVLEHESQLKKLAQRTTSAKRAKCASYSSALKDNIVDTALQTFLAAVLVR
jgi:hypothetical protein